MSKPRRHHYISQGYLRGFASKNGKKKQLWVLDLENNSQFSTNPTNVASKRDYNRVEIDGVDPNAFEKSFSHFEGDAIEAIRSLEESSDFSGETKSYLINLIAFYFSRTPRIREQFRKFHEDIYQMSLKTSLATPERWKTVSEQFKKDRPDEHIDIPYEEMIDFVKEKQYSFSLRTEYHIEIELRLIESLVTLLAQRNWILVHTGEDTGPFVTSDNPVVIAFKNPNEIPPFYRESPGFGMNGTVVIFPVTQNLLLAGDFEGDPGIAGASVETVAQMNSAVIRRASRQIYGPSSNFVYLDNERKIRNGSSLLENQRKD